MNIYVTGASGFVGQSLIKYLNDSSHLALSLHRNSVTDSIIAIKRGIPVDCIIHLAGRAHVMHETASDIYLPYREANVDYTLKVAALAKSLSVKRFVFLSSVKVNGELTKQPFTEQNSPSPQDAYGQTKLEAELLLNDFCEKNDMELVIIRPPLIYGPGVKANFNSLINLCRKPIPLPFGCISNKRSLISLDNLNNFIELCCHHPAAANQTFLISDDHDVSTTELIHTIRTAMGQRAFLLPIPSVILKVVFSIMGKKNLSERLLNNLQVDTSKAKQLLGWKPVISFNEGIKKTINEHAS
jgi:UDP-glucose 4-epimerase